MIMCCSADRVLEMCGLGPFADAIIGTLGTEEKKRTTIGVELAAKVSIRLSFLFTKD